MLTSPSETMQVGAQQQLLSGYCCSEPDGFLSSQTSWSLGDLILPFWSSSASSLPKLLNLAAVPRGPAVCLGEVFAASHLWTVAAFARLLASTELAGYSQYALSVPCLHQPLDLTLSPCRDPGYRARALVEQMLGTVKCFLGKKSVKEDRALTLTSSKSHFHSLGNFTNMIVQTYPAFSSLCTRRISLL